MALAALALAVAARGQARVAQSCASCHVLSV